MVEETSINLSIAIAYFVMLVLISALPILYLISRAKILKAENGKQLAVFKAAQEAEEKQRERIASTLHDEVVPLLTAIVQNYEINIRNIEQNKVSLEIIKEGKSITIQSIESVKNAALELIPKELLKYGLLAALSSHVKRLNQTISASIENATLFETLPFNKPSELHIYRLSLELIQNLIKHAEIKELKIKIDCENDNIMIAYGHDGKGVANSEMLRLEQSSNGLGLKSIRSRLISLNAKIDYIKTETNSAVIVNIPFYHETN